MQARLSASDIACRRGDRVLFRGLSLNLSAGDALHIAGANGIGKSSLLRIVAGLLSPFAGEISSEGAIALLDERPALDPDLPLRQSLDFWRSIDGGDDAESAPLSGLDTGAQAKFAALIEQHLSNGGICLLASHQPVAIERLQSMALGDFAL